MKTFLCHCSEDKQKVKELYNVLRQNGVEPWLDAEALLPGQDWNFEIPKAVQASKVVIVCLSKHSLNKEGYVQKEIKIALDVADQKPEGTIFIIPARLEECDVPSRLQKYHWVNLFDEDGIAKLMSSIRRRAISLNENFGPVEESGAIGRESISVKKYNDQGILYHPESVEIVGLTSDDNIVLKIACQTAISNQQSFWIDTQSIKDTMSEHGLKEEQMQESLEILDDEGYIRNVGKSLGRSDIYAFTITTFGFSKYAEAYVPDYNQIIKEAANYLLEERVGDSQPSTADAAQSLSRPELFIEHAFDYFEEQGWLKQAKAIGGKSWVVDVKPQLKRWSRQQG